MSKFQVGMKGKTRSGDTYKIIADDIKNTDYPIVAVVTVGSIDNVMNFTASGRYSKHINSIYDIMLPEAEAEEEKPVKSREFTVGMKGKTRNGLDYEIVATDLSGSENLLVIITSDDGSRIEGKRNASGKCDLLGTDYDLIHADDDFSHSVWFNIYAYGFSDPYSTKNLADYHAVPDRIACICVEIKGKVGDGLQ